MAQLAILSYTIQDDDGVKASLPLYRLVGTDADTSVGDLKDAWVAMGALIDAVTGGVIIGGNVNMALPPDGPWKDEPITGQSVSDTLGENFSVAENLRLYGISVPAIRDTLIVDGRPNIATGAIAALNTALLTGAVGLTSTNQVGFDLTALVDAFQGVRKHRKQLTAKSRVTA